MKENKTGKKSITLRLNIVVTFAMIFALFAAFIVWFNYSQNTRSALQIADRLMADISEKIRERVEGHLQPLFTMAELLPELPEVGRKPEGLNHSANSFFMRTLDQYPQILSLYIGFGDGDFFQIQALTPDDSEIKTQLEAPEDTRFALRRIESDFEQKRETSWQFLNSNRLPLSSRSLPASPYDPRERPWYEAAEESNNVIITNLYVFESSGEIGLTFARRIDGDVASVFGADVTLDSLSSFLNLQRLGPSSRLLIFDGEGLVVAHSDKEKLLTDASGQVEAVRILELDDPVIEQFMTTFTTSNNAVDEQLSFGVNGDRYVGRVTRLPLVEGVDWYLAFAVPTQVFTAPITSTGEWSAYISLGIAALVLPILFFAARLISRPLNELADEADTIRDFHLDEPVSVRSRVREVQHLTQAISTAKTALQTFGRYVPKELVKQLVQSGEVAEVGGQRRTITLMFSDIQDFTTIVEGMPPEALMHQMSLYLRKLGGAILTNGGTIDKYIGDAIMAFWNAPLSDHDHAFRACVSALECRARSVDLNEKWRQEGEPEFVTRFGLHLGEAVVGNIGSPDRMDYTAIGETVNLAARLEGLNKYYDTQILISETIAEVVGDRFVLRPVDLVLAKGATRPVEIFELVGAVGDIPQGNSALNATIEQKRYCADWAVAFRAYRDRKWQVARDAFTALREGGQSDRLLEIYIERATGYSAAPPPENWDGVEAYDTK